MDTLEVPGLLGHVHINNFQHFKSRIAWSGPGFWKAFGALRRRFGVPSRRHPEIFTVKPLMSMSAYHWLVCSLPHLGYNLSNSLNSFTVIIWYIFDPFCSYMCSKFIYGSLINMFFFSGEVQPAQPHPARMPRSWSRPWCSKSPRSGSRRANCSSTRGSSRLQIRRRKKTAAESAKGFWGSGVKDIDGVWMDDLQEPRFSSRQLLGIPVLGKMVWIHGGICWKPDDWILWASWGMVSTGKLNVPIELWGKWGKTTELYSVGWRFCNVFVFSWENAPRFSVGQL